MNELQEAVFDVIASILSIENLHKHFDKEGPWGDTLKIKHATIRYGLLNYVAKFSLANETYFVTKKSKEHLIKNDFLKDGILKRGDKGKHSGFTYEHPVPSNIIANMLYENRHDHKTMCNILLKTNYVTVLTYEENDMLRINGFTKNMPKGWTLAHGHIFERYIQSNLEIPEERIKVAGAIAR